MLYQRLILICSLSSFLAGCAGLYEKQPPAPVFGGQKGGAIQPAPSQSRTTMPMPPAQTPPQVVKTNPLKDFKQTLRPMEIVPAPVYSEPAIGEDSALEPSSPELATQQALPLPEMPEQKNLLTAPEPEAVALTPFEPIEPPASLSPAIGALVIAANENSQSGNVESATASIDRALKIDPRNPALYYKLALLRLKQSKPQEAEDLAKKSALLAAGNKQLKRHSWLLIAHARELRRDFKGAKEARAKANSF